MTSLSLSSTGRTARRALVATIGALALACGGAQAAPHGGPGWHGGGHVVYRGGWGWDPLWPLGVGLGLGLVAAATASPVYVDSPGYVVVNPAPAYYYPPAPVYVTTPAAAPAAPAAKAPDPIFYPRNGQSAAQTEADRQACNTWATTVPSAMNDASIFQRATLACMDGRGYTAR